MTASPRCPRKHRGSWPNGVPMDRILTEGGGWSCPGILLDGTDCGFELTVAGHPAGREIPAAEEEALRANRAELKLAWIGNTVSTFLAQYGESELPAFKVALDLAHSLRKILRDDDGEPAEHTS